VITAKAFAGKHYAVYGLARSGLATVEALLASGARVTAWDANEAARENAVDAVMQLSHDLEEVQLVIADLDTADLTQFDSLVVTPGLPRAELPPHKVVGITGTNGKSTTTALVHHILQTAGVPSLMGGNIGLPILSQDPLPEGGVYVLELSSYQIDLTQSLDCDVAVLLNITPDHLDRYESFEAYAASKFRLVESQSQDQRWVVTDDVIVTQWERDAEDYLPEPNASDRSYFSSIKSSHAEVSVIEGVGRIDSSRFGFQRNWPSLQGPHNAQNAAAAAAVATLLKIELPQISEALRTYPGLPHRMERIREKDGVLFVNDSKATNATATAPALAAFPAIRWICGGQAKSDNLDECAPHFGHVRTAYTIGEASDLFARLLAPHMPVAECGDLAHAVLRAANDAQPGETVLLSPACASFDQFRDFEARGDAFRTLVGAL